ncbi:YlxR family protein [Marmoricola sp. Leaf446]|uniref:YlxR family protein n=1 Tax=Marmoricola sp. Leaf446 TaxID=1736379 RepID=UPI0009E6AD9B|nr:YlxR family protein [Marmoricola sp. Leaf446]
MVFQQDTQRGDGPVRTCVGCRRKAPKRELLRVVVRAGPDGQAPWHVEPDPVGSAPGRGAHLHPTVACLALAERKRAFTRALRHDAQARGALSLDRLRRHLADLQLPAPPAPTQSAPIRNGSTSS